MRSTWLGISSTGRVDVRMNTAPPPRAVFRPAVQRAVAHTLNIRLFPEQLTYIVNMRKTR